MSYKPNKGMQEEAERAIAWVEEGRKGGTRIGKIRARQIARGEDLSEDTVKRMYSFFSRQEGVKDAEGFEPGEDGYPSPGRVAWGLWGGDPGYSWSKNIVEQLKNRGYSMNLITRELVLETRDGYEYGDNGEKEYEEKENDLFTFVVSTPEIDRYGTIIVPSGIDYTAYLANPIVLAQHDSDKWPIGRCLGFAMNGENLEATIQIECVTEEGKKLTKLINAGFVKAVSVGIIPIEYEDQTIEGKKVTVYTKSELVEFSVVSVPANRQALLKKSLKTLLQESINKYKKETRMLTPEIEAKIADELLPAIKDAFVAEVINLGFSPEEAEASVNAFITAGVPPMLAVLKGEAVAEEPAAEPPVQVVSEPAPAAAPAPAPEEVVASFEGLETRVGKKIAASTQAQIAEGMDMINKGYKTIKAAVGVEAGRSITLNLPKKFNTEDLINLI
jgi:HK97 family phage prohead protease